MPDKSLSIFRNILICPDCKKKFKLKKINNNFLIFQCICNQYPIIENKILYLKNDLIKDKLIKKLKKNKPFLHLFSFSFLTNILFRLKIIEKFLKKLSFNSLINFFLLIGYDKNYAKYLLLRKKIPSYYIACILNQIINKNKIIIDFGCGFGHNIENLSKNQLKIGIDKDFLSLYFNLNYIDKNSFFVCYDFDNKNLPLKNNSINQFTFIDGFHNIKNKNFFIKELKRILKNNYQGFISHNLNTNVNTYNHFYPEKPSKIKKILNHHKFKNYKIISSAKIWNSLKNKKIISLKSKDIENPKVYNLIFTKKEKIDIGKKILKKIKDEKINYYQDNDLLNDSKIYEKNIFIFFNFFSFFLFSNLSLFIKFKNILF